jgi:chitin disaccharide deacetylase
MTARIPPGLIVNADDLAIHPRINAGILSAWRDGIVTSATMLMTTPYLEETVRAAVRAARLPVGIHLALTLGKAVAGHGEVPDLTDEAGSLTWTAQRLLLCTFASEEERRLLAQIRRELEAQLALARDHGVRATHADSHQHVHMNPAIFALVEELLPRFGIARVRTSREALPWRTAASALANGQPINLAKVALLRWLGRRIDPRLATTDAFFGVINTGKVTKPAIMAAIAGLAADRSLEMCVHPGFPVAAGEATYGPTDVNTWIASPARQTEHDALTDVEVGELVRRRAIVLRCFDGTEKVA